MAVASSSVASEITANAVPRQRFASEGGSIGWQVGGSDSDVVMLIMNPEGERSEQGTLWQRANRSRDHIDASDPPPAAQALIVELIKYSPREGH
jgi:hypothetical protein